VNDVGTSDRQGLAEMAGALRALHHAGRPLVLANAWDAWSAGAIERAGLPAVATSSAAVVASLGYRDGGVAPVDEVFAALARICRAVQVPVTADIEDGYGLRPSELVARLLEAGAVGCNLEDSDHRGERRTLVETGAHCERLAAVHEVANREQVPLVINARVDVLIRQVGDEADRVDRCVERAAAYLEAGADCVYPITLGIDDAVASELVRRIDGPVNLLAFPTPEEVARLAATGARRISTGSGILLALDHQLNEIAAGLRAAG
jgi:2-methylisocitrate lyase-like PEP mutase family enzyme